ncbi:3-oxo-tetronate kinase [Paracoccus luteus]|uniref:3-oxo-tetronate kinase n=1 Tax=Paracoccus luteus TaxID=2508543 RepID=UPI001070050C|nr:3-oxo-tetronate kinase [Paracoccus luteus]
MTPALGCIADDVTGASDLAALLARSGARVSLRFGVPDADEDADEIEVIALKIRTVPVAEAVAQARAALGWLRAAGARRFFWKYCSTFDSTPQGNIGPVAEALTADLGAPATIYAPSFPENGRTVWMGNLFVGRQPLAESPMRDHPLTPMRDSDLTRLLGRQVRGRVGLVDGPTVAQGPDAIRAAFDAAVADGVAHVVADAVDDAGLDAIAAACADLPLLTGGSALARPLPALLRAAGELAPPAAAASLALPAGPALVLSGSCSAMTRRQVAAMIDAGAPALRLDPLAIARDGIAAARDWLAAQTPDRPALVYATADPDAVRQAQDRLGREAAGSLVEDAMARLAQDARARGVTRIVVAGGETSGAVVAALGVRRLAIGREIAPGVPWTRAQDAAGPFGLALKSGNFGGPEFFAQALAAASAA